MDSKRRDNLHDAQQYFNYDLTKNKYNKTNTVEYFKNFDYGVAFGLGSISLLDIPKENLGEGFVEGMTHARTLLKFPEKLYNLGREYYFNGEAIPEIYMENDSFMEGYIDAREATSIEEEKENVGHHRH